MLKSYKTEIKPTAEQAMKIKKTIGTCRFIYNFYIAHNQEIYEKEHRFVSGMNFEKWMNGVYLIENPEKMWIKEVSAKSVKQSIMNADKAFRNFFHGKSHFPRFKKKGTNECKMYFVKNDKKTIICCERHRIRIPTLGWVRLKEKGYFPTNPETHTIKSGTVSYHAGRYYVSIVVEEAEVSKPKLNAEGLGVDLGLKEFMVISNGVARKNINNTSKVKKLEKQLKRAQRSQSRKYEDLKKREKKKGEATRKNIEKGKRKVQKYHHRLACIREDYINQCVNELVKTKPAYITIEDLNVRGMMKNRHLSRAIASQGFFTFRKKLVDKCHASGIEVRIVDRFYPSSKTCHACGKLKKDLKLSDRIYRCECGHEMDRDLNASLNLRDAKTYQLA